jgi:hypothetical protein
LELLLATPLGKLAKMTHPHVAEPQRDLLGVAGFSSMNIIRPLTTILLLGIRDIAENGPSRQAGVPLRQLNPRAIRPAGSV